MQIRIISEKKVSPLKVGFPDRNPMFTNISLPRHQHLPKPNERGLLQVFMHQKAHDSMWRHSQLSIQQELGGALMGYYCEDNGQRFLLITDVLHQPPSYYASPTLLRFTTQFYDDLNQHIDQVQREHPHLLRLGMYHTHPGYGVFLSNTDVDTFKGIFKDVFQIALVVDPLKNEEGVFSWLNGDVSPPSPFKLYETQNPQYQPHSSTTFNPVLAQYNSHLQLHATQHIQPNIEYPSDIPLKTVTDKSFKLTQTHQHTSKREKISLTKQPKITIHKQEKEQISIEPLEFIPRMCPLYNMKYKNYQVKLYRYFRPIKTDVQFNEFPFYVFVHLSIKEKLIHLLQTQTSITALLKGRFHFDKLKNLYFLDFFDLILDTHTDDLHPTNKIVRLYQEQDVHNKIQTLGWLHLSPQLKVPAFHFLEKHKSLFSKNQYLGMLIGLTSDGTPDFNNMNLVAHNFDFNQPFDHFRHFFLYEKPY